MNKYLENNYQQWKWLPSFLCLFTCKFPSAANSEWQHLQGWRGQNLVAACDRWHWRHQQVLHSGQSSSLIFRGQNISRKWCLILASGVGHQVWSSGATCLLVYSRAYAFAHIRKIHLKMLGLRLAVDEGQQTGIQYIDAVFHEPSSLFIISKSKHNIYYLILFS